MRPICSIRRSDRFDDTLPAAVTPAALSRWRTTVMAPAALLALLGAGAPAGAERIESTSKQVFEGVVTWPEEQRRFVQDGPQLLLEPEAWRQLFDLDSVGRDAWIAAFLDQDPIPESEENELIAGIERRRELALRAIPSFQDHRTQLLFLHGPPDTRQVIDCAETFKPLELWTFGAGTPSERTLVLYQPKAGEPWQLWLPLDNKSSLYTEEMAYYLEQWEELKRYITGGRRIDRTFCDDSERVDRITGVDSLFGFRDGRPKDSDLLAWLDPPEDLAAWARKAAGTPLPTEQPIESPVQISLFYPERQGLRMVTRVQAKVEHPGALGVFEEGESKQARLVLDGQLERYDQIFEDFRVRFQIPYPDGGFSDPLALHADVPLRPGQRFLLRLRLRDEVTDRVLYFHRGLEVASEATPIEEVPVPDAAIQAISDDLAQ
ncbi:MAG: hypothetical protein MI919_41395, partial [Holophagales bacterium]|nr:hypothetical protein [Holophagales bacterium]